MRRYQTALDESQELEAAYLGMPLERTATRLQTRARELARHGEPLVLPDGTEIQWQPKTPLPRGHIQHDPAKVSELNWLLAKKSHGDPWDHLYRRLQKIDNLGREWDGLPGTTVCYEER